MNRQEISLARFLMQTAEGAFDQQDEIQHEKLDPTVNWELPMHGSLRAIENIARKAFQDLTGRPPHEVSMDDLNPEAPAFWAATHIAGERA